MLQCAIAYLALKTDRRAASALEYGMIAGIIVVTIALGFSSLADGRCPTNTYRSVASSDVSALAEPRRPRALAMNARTNR